ncbi:MAG TPA: PPOX class F420-dependent oxidoreductase [Ktedonobacterales bacterium]|nr:PPOX class F420-dependent oxidoreductase [Ktedonobacterales bacterium]
MRAMSEREYRAFLTTHPHTMKLATVRADGAPHVVPVWFTLDGDTVVFTADGASAKAAHLRRDPRVALCVDDETPPFAYVVIEGTATLDTDLAELRRWAAIIGGRYMGAERAEEYGQRNGVAGELLVRVTPVRIVARAGIAE